jgi:acetyl-CoA carboxylase biotin carboxylase subunit
MFQGATVPPFYDSLIAKLIVHADDRAGAIARLDRALGEYAINKISTNLPLQRRILASEDFIQSEIDVVWLERWLKTQ